MFILPVFIQAEDIDYTKRLYPMEEKGKRYFVNIHGERVTEAIYDNDMSYNYENDNDWIYVKKENFYGTIDIQGNEILPCIYEAHWFYVHEDLMALKKGKWGLYSNRRGNILTHKYDGIKFLDTNNVCVQHKGMWGVVNLHTKKECVPFNYTNLYVCPKVKLLEVSKQNNWGYIDYEGNTIIPLIHSEIRGFGNEKYAVLKHHKNENWYIYDIKGQRTEIGKFDEVGDVVEEMIMVKKNNLYGFINAQTGKLVIPCAYTDATRCQDGLIYVWKKGEGNGYFIDKNGCIISNKELCLNRGVIDGYIYGYHANKYGTGHRYGCIDSKGNTIIPFIYEATGRFDENSMMIPVKSVDNKKWGVVNRDNRIVIPFEYDNIYVGDNLIKVEKDDKWGVVDVQNNLKIPILYDEIINDRQRNDYIRVRNGNKYAYIDKEGFVVIPFGDYESTALKIDQYLFSKLPSDVDTNIPYMQNKSEKTFAVIISNEKYSEPNITDVQYANKDGKIFAEYCKKTLGIPGNNIHIRENATLNQIRSEVNWLKDISEAYSGEAKIIFYYAGHGIPDESDATSYLLPSDGIGNDVRSAYCVSDLYAELGQLPAEQVTVFMDACFSGAKRDGKMLSDARSVAIIAKQTAPQGNMVVFSAAQGDETAYQYKMKKHGIFTYFLLKKLQETKGNVTLEELSNYITTQVKQHSIREHGKLQTPTLQISPNITDISTLKLY